MTVTARSVDSAVLRRLVICPLLLVVATPARSQEPPPIIDVHLHAYAANAQGPPPIGICAPFEQSPAWDPSRPYAETFMAMLKQPPCTDPIWSPATDGELMRQTIDVMERRNIFGILSGTPNRVATWRAAAPERFYPGLQFRLGPDSPSPDTLETLHAAGRLSVLAEITNQYAGIAPDDERMEPYWSLAEALDIPVGIHVGPGPPGAIYLGFKHYRASLHSPLALEDVLVRHPKLRLYIMHAGFPMLDELLALLYSHPQVYVGVGVIVYTTPRPAFYRYLRGIVEGGFGNRVMFGSDQMVWPDAIEKGLGAIENAPFLSKQQKRDILYNNAARFLRLSEEEIDRHHGR